MTKDKENKNDLLKEFILDEHIDEVAKSLNKNKKKKTLNRTNDQQNETNKDDKNKKKHI